MSIVSDSLIIYKREMLIFKSKLRTNLIRSLIFPLVLILMLGNLGANSDIITNIGVVNYASNPSAYNFVQSLQSNNDLNVEMLTTQQAALSALKAGQITDVVVISPSFPSLNTQNPGIYIYYANNFADLGNSVNIIESLAEQYESNIGKPIEYSSTSSPDQVVSDPAYAADASYRTFLVGGVIVMVAVFGSMFGGGMSIITDRQLGNLKSFLITPINKLSIILGKIMSGTTQALIYGVIAILIGLLDGATVAMGIAGVAIILVLIALTAVAFSAITIILASRISKIEVYSIIANAITLPLWFISGAFFPTSSLPSWLYPLSVIDPLTYSASGIRYIMMYGYYPINSAILDFSVLIAFSVVVLLLSFKLFSTTIGK
ncbi:DrugE1 family ABC transporter permease [Candidatus Mancarchaeum acidiphilum]|uniref:DrugE1 family ABC transporter permease n=1 Tax=Candidatus Mancarchaeum acidiphilum TaxID=1920749 RepID=A0A218NM51_9ARCH|nr:ABC transporter permease [Candidatus Mancarchaeum acidiphilum]ASI13532.1 DrugE1 family ABC transporter permease [Candidatus Mancarchaeum acidiphilum]